MKVFCGMISSLGGSFNDICNIQESPTLKREKKSKEQLIH
uniref:Uncharacterized protein n=1 Tax=Lepeophtheirus salmonis TaxID=72036 RepID=A0A0K2U7B9_LEPSM